MHARIAALLLACLLCAGAAAQSLRPEPGLWYNPERSGHGVDFQFAGNTLVGIWYTYDALGQPTWYIASGAYSGSSWTAPLLSARWDGSSATLTPVGTISLTVHERDRADFSWNLNGDSGGEPFEKLRYASGAPVANLTGIYHHAAQTGWGLSFEVQGSTAAAVLYFYDSSGLPRWALGTGPVQLTAADKAGAEAAMQVFLGGFTPDSPAAAAPIGQAAGRVSLTGDRLIVDLIFTGILWRRDVPPTRLTDDDPPFLEASVSGPAFIPANGSAGYSVGIHTNLRNLEGLQYEWRVLYGDRIVQANTPAVQVSPMGDEGLVSIQVEVSHPPSGLADFATLSASAQLADLFDAAIVARHPGVLAGRDNQFDAITVGGRAPFSYFWQGANLASSDLPSTSVQVSCNSAVGAELRVRVTDADRRVANARLAYSVDAAGCGLRITGPGCLEAGQTGSYVARFDWEEDPLPSPGGFTWTLPADQPGACDGSAWCRLTGIAGPPGAAFILQTTSIIGISAGRRIQRHCPEGPQLAMLARPATLSPSGSEAAVDFTVTGGLPPFRIDLNCIFGDETVLPGGAGAQQSGLCHFTPKPAGSHLVRARVMDSLSRSQQQEIRIPVVDPNALQASLDSPATPQTCVPLDFVVGLVNGSPPFDVSFDFGDGSTVSERVSERNLILRHEYAASGGGTLRNLRLLVTDSSGGRVERSATLTPLNAAMAIDVALRNGAAQNIHIYDRSTPAGGWFAIDTRITPGSQRIATVTIPASSCESQVEWGAGRNSTQLTERTCSYRKREPNPTLNYSEAGGPSLSCD